MAKLVDSEPKYEGEKKVWKMFSLNLPQDWIVYNNRSVNGREYDSCVIAPGIGLFIVEIKGWNSNDILTVVNENTIFMAGKEKPEDSPRGQARGYRFDLRNKIISELGMNLLVMSLVCYPFISEKQYMEKGLNIVSEVNETIFCEELEDPQKLYQKFLARYNIDKGAKHDELNSKRLSLLRHHFEPNYDFKMDAEVLNPGYSRLRTALNDLPESMIIEITEEYFNGIKEIVFVSSSDDLQRIVQKLNEEFQRRQISPDKNDLVIGFHAITHDNMVDSFNIFNFDVFVLPSSISVEKDILIEEGKYNADEEELLLRFASTSAFNFQQYKVEHAPSESNILVTAGAGTGKTYSMVSRIAYLCNRTTDSVIDISSEICMITFTNDAADNMKSRLKRMFMNYFILTSNEKYMHYIEDMNQIQISTIHKFAISVLQRNCIRMGLGYESQISSEIYNRRQLYHFYLNEYINEKTNSNPDFTHQLNYRIYELEDLLIGFADKLYDRSIDIKDLSIADFGEPVVTMPYFNELVEKVIMKAELDYATALKKQNMIGLNECMIYFSKLIKSGYIAKQGYRFRYIFVDEFQDTDDVQIETIAGLQKIFGNNCKLFVVGDLKQSIYRFRGASMSAFDKVKSTNADEKWIEYSLSRNYRTDCRLLEKFHSIFLRMNENELLPYDEKKDRLTSKILKEYSDEELLKVVETHADNMDSFYDDLFSTLSDQKKHIEQLNLVKKLKSDEKKIAILVRYNFQISNIVKEGVKRGVPIKVAEGGDLYRIPSTMDFYKLVLAITHPSDKLHLTNLLRSNYVSLNVDFSSISGYTAEEKTEELIRLLDEYFMLYMGKTWNQVIMDFETRPVLVVLRDIYEATKPWVHFTDDTEKKNYRANYECLIEKITNRYSREYLTINMVAEFLRINITTYQEDSSRSDKAESTDVQILCTTIHKSKGLEYGTVIIPFTNEDISDINVGRLIVNVINGKITYSLSNRDGSDFSGGFDPDAETKEKMCEESRILYVALTRSIRNLVWFKDLDTADDTSWCAYLEEG